MASQLSSLGMPVSSEKEILEIARQALVSAIRIPVGQSAYQRWVSPCGAELWLILTDDNVLVGMGPCFRGQARVKVQITNRLPGESGNAQDGAFYGWANPKDGTSSDTDDGNVTFPLVFEASDFACHADLRLPSVVDVNLTAFANEIKIYASLDDFNSAPTDPDAISFAWKSFIPTGLFPSDHDSDSSPKTCAIMTGRVVATAVKNNSLTQIDYYWAEVESLGGNYDVVIDPDLCSEPLSIGNIISGSFWLSGRIIQQHDHCVC